MLVLFVAFSMPAEVLDTNVFLATTGYSFDLCDGLFRVVVYVLLIKHLVWLCIVTGIS